jgi:hypothetical protein
VIQFIQNYKPRGKTLRTAARAAALIAGGALTGAGVRP